jgi:4-hydroxy-3-methylbut-2-en-1-yl diphosphate reductase
VNAPAQPSPALKILLASPRGFCAGVDRAIQIVEKTIEKYGAPVFVRHEIVHNRRVVERLEALGAVFVDELDDCPDDRPVIFSAHGVPKSVPTEAKRRELNFLDATCPLVSKVHVQAERQFRQGKEIVLIGHAGHPEVVGTMGQLPENAMTLLENAADAEAFVPKDPDNLAFCTQTTLSLDDTAEIIAILQRRFPSIEAPYKEDICYATTNRQDAVKAIAPKCDLILVLGAPNSSNSVRLVEVAKRHGAPNAQLVESADDVDWSWFAGVKTLGVTAGASAPEDLVEALIDAVRARFSTDVESVEVTRENVTFRLPRALTMA